MSTYLTMKLVLTLHLFLFLLIFFPCFRLYNSWGKTKTHTQLLHFSLSLSFLLFLSLFPSLSLKLVEASNPTLWILSLSLSLSLSLFANCLAGTKVIHWYALAKSHYRFLILVIRHVLFWDSVEFFFVDSDLGINFCSWVCVIIALVCFDLGFQF